MTDYRDVVDADICLAILRLLNEDPGGSHNDSVLEKCLRAMGHDRPRRVVRNHVSFLEQKALVTIEELESVWVVAITDRGAEVAGGYTEVEGVAKPSRRRT